MTLSIWHLDTSTVYRRNLALKLEVFHFGLNLANFGGRFESFFRSRDIVIYKCPYIY